VVVHLPSHGGQHTNVHYVVKPNGPSGGVLPTCPISQGAAASAETDRWISLGAYDLWPGGQVQLDNLLDGTGDVDVAYDAIAFVPVANMASRPCGYWWN
jgi:hypothetical protein